jgi:hypothetical protein
MIIGEDYEQAGKKYIAGNLSVLAGRVAKKVAVLLTQRNIYMNLYYIRHTVPASLERDKCQLRREEERVCLLE